MEEDMEEVTAEAVITEDPIIQAIILNTEIIEDITIIIMVVTTALIINKHKNNKNVIKKGENNMKNKINKKAVILISIAIMVLGSASVFAQYGRGYGNGMGYGRGYGNGMGYGRGCGYGYGRGYGYYNNNLTQEQIDEIRAIHDKYFPQMDTLRREIFNQNETIAVEMRKENPDQNAINAAIDARSKASADLSKLRTQCYLEIDKVYQNK